MIYLINIIGRDKKGLFAQLTSIMSAFEINILDAGQSVIHEQVNIGILVEIPKKIDESVFMKEFLFEAHQAEVQAKFTPIADDDYEHWVGEQGKERHIITLLGRKVTAKQIHLVSKSISNNQLNIESITRLSGRLSLKSPAKFPSATPLATSIEEPITTQETQADNENQDFEQYSVGKNDTLQKISKKFYNTTKKWPKIYEANKDILRTPDKLYPGQTLKIPKSKGSETEENLK